MKKLKNICRICKIPLTDNNWYPGNRKYRIRLCIKCTKNYSKQHRLPKEERNLKHKEWRKKIRIKALEKCGGVFCVYCGCDTLGYLEINHKDGGGKNEVRRGWGFYEDIAMGRRNTDDLETTCKVHNALHALTLKYGKKVFTEFTITWKGKK